MMIIGLTGAVAMGKSTLSRMFRFHRIPVFDADQKVHEILKNDQAVIAAIRKNFPKAVTRGAVDRKILGQIIFNDPDDRTKLESILHPYVWRARKKFLERHRRTRQAVVALDIPLLFETGSYRATDLNITVSAPAFLQKIRAMQRPGMTVARFNAIRASQLSDLEKRRRADIVIPSGLGRAYTMRVLKRILASITEK